MRNDWHYDPNCRTSLVFFYSTLNAVVVIDSFLIGLLMAAVVDAHDHARRGDPPAPFFYPPTDWSAYVTLYVAPLLIPAITLVIMQLGSRLIAAANRRSSTCSRISNYVVSIRSVDCRATSFLVIWILLYVAYMTFTLKYSRQVEWYLKPLSPGVGAEALAAEADWRLEPVKHPRGFSITLDKRWAKKILTPSSPAAIVLDTTCYGHPVGCPIFSLAMLDQKPDLSGLEQTTFQDHPAYELANADGGDRVRCFEYQLIFERNGKWFRIDYWFPNNRKNRVTELPPMMRTCLETFDYTP